MGRGNVGWAFPDSVEPNPRVSLLHLASYLNCAWDTDFPRTYGPLLYPLPIAHSIEHKLAKLACTQKLQNNDYHLGPIINEIQI